MRDIRVDGDGRLHCWYCGGVNFTEKRTFRSKLTFGIGALLTRKKMRCQECSHYNRQGRAKPYVQPASRRWRKIRAKAAAAAAERQRQATEALEPRA